MSPTRPRQRCTACKQLHSGKGRCDTCRKKLMAEYDRKRGTATERGYGQAHREQFRAPVLARDPICVICHSAPSTVADHYPLTRRQLVQRGMNPNNPAYGRGLCKRCHDQHTTTIEGGNRWGRRAGGPGE